MYMPTDHEQYCAMRVGPAYPLELNYFPRPPLSLMPEESIVPDGFTYAYGHPDATLFTEGHFSLHSIRIRTEIKVLREIIKLISKGLSIFRSLKKNDDISRLINMGEYMICCFRTDIHVKQMFIYRQKLFIAPTKDAVRKLISQTRRLGEAEIKNAERALICVDFDSSLGFEPVMGYVGDRAHIEWKIRQVRYMMTVELGQYEAGLNF